MDLLDYEYILQYVNKNNPELLYTALPALAEKAGLNFYTVKAIFYEETTRPTFDTMLKLHAALPPRPAVKRRKVALLNPQLGTA